MSDEFLKVATQEINDELAGITIILASCKGDEDVVRNSDKIERHMHKIKGLAPMMGKENVGTLAKSLDVILKKLVDGQSIDGFFEPLLQSITEMKTAMVKSHDLDKINEQILKISQNH